MLTHAGPMDGYFAIENLAVSLFFLSGGGERKSRWHVAPYAGVHSHGDGRVFREGKRGTSVHLCKRHAEHQGSGAAIHATTAVDGTGAKAKMRS